MLTSGQKKYLGKLGPKRSNLPIMVKPYNPRTKQVAENYIREIKDNLPNADIRFMGSSALGISGQNDVDIYVVCQKDSIEKYTSKLNGFLQGFSGKKWKWTEDGIETSVSFLVKNTTKTKEQIEIFEILRKNPNTLKSYEDLKISLIGKSYKEYQIAKYYFYNEVLGIKK